MYICMYVCMYVYNVYIYVCVCVFVYVCARTMILSVVSFDRVVSVAWVVDGTIPNCWSSCWLHEQHSARDSISTSSILFPSILPETALRVPCLYNRHIETNFVHHPNYRAIPNMIERGKQSPSLISKSRLKVFALSFRTPRLCKDFSDHRVL